MPAPAAASCTAGILPNLQRCAGDAPLAERPGAFPDPPGPAASHAARGPSCAPSHALGDPTYQCKAMAGRYGRLEYAVALSNLCECEGEDAPTPDWRLGPGGWGAPRRPLDRMHRWPQHPASPDHDANTDRTASGLVHPGRNRRPARPHCRGGAGQAVWGQDRCRLRFPPGPMLAPVQGALSAADLAVCHLETPLSADDRRISGYPTFNTPTSWPPPSVRPATTAARSPPTTPWTKAHRGSRPRLRRWTVSAWATLAPPAARLRPAGPSSTWSTVSGSGCWPTPTG